MLLDFAAEFIVELVRTLVIEEICRRVRDRSARIVQRRRQKRIARDALHRLSTGDRENL